MVKKSRLNNNNHHGRGSGGGGSSKSSAGSIGNINSISRSSSGEAGDDNNNINSNSNDFFDLSSSTTNNNNDYHPQSNSQNNENSMNNHHPYDNSTNNANSDDEDFCQRFFGDVLFTNFNVGLLFIIATLLPALLWIPHVLTDYYTTKLNHQQQHQQHHNHLSSNSAYYNRIDDDFQQQQTTTSTATHTTATMYDPITGGYISPEDVTTTLDPYHHHVDVITNKQYEELLHNTGGSNTPTYNNNQYSPQQQKVEQQQQQQQQGQQQQQQQQQQQKTVPSLSVSPRRPHERVTPHLCPDGTTIGFDDIRDLRDAIYDTNDDHLIKLTKYNDYIIATGGNKGTWLDSPQYRSLDGNVRTPAPFVICPGVTLTQYGRAARWSTYHRSNSRSRNRGLVVLTYITSWVSPTEWLHYLAYQVSSYHRNWVRKRRRKPVHHTTMYDVGGSGSSTSSIFISAEDVIVECNMCAIDMPGTHIRFGPHAKHVTIRGITFKGATTSSLTFYHHGANVRLEDCYWLYNSGAIIKNSLENIIYGDDSGGGGSSSSNNNNYGNNNNNPTMTTMAGAVADLNSTSVMKFYRCIMDDVKQNPKRTTTGAGVANVPGMNPPGGHNYWADMNRANGGGAGVASSSLTLRNN